ncbi:MAG: MazG-like family protein [Candidatus Babeliales bacterium]
MNDATTTLKQLKDQVEKLVQEREWQQFHTPKNLSMAIAIEAAEVMEHFKWVKSDESYEEFEKHRLAIEDEVADTLITLLCFANRTNIDISAAFARKIEEIKKKYPIEKAKGRSDKYTTYL